jgi:hypothetical protein
MHPVALCKSGEDRIVVCIRCFQYGFRCDNGDPCTQCVQAHARCKRAKCEHFEAGTCSRLQCTRAHENDGFDIERLGDCRHVSKRKPRMKRRQRRNKKGSPKDGDDKEVDGMIALEAE